MPTTMPNINDHELADIYAFAVQLGKDAGRMLMAAIQARNDAGSESKGSTTVSYIEKDSSVDIVTQTDNGRAL